MHPVSLGPGGVGAGSGLTLTPVLTCLPAGLSLKPRGRLRVCMGPELPTPPFQAACPSPLSPLGGRSGDPVLPGRPGLPPPNRPAQCEDSRPPGAMDPQFAGVRNGHTLPVSQGVAEPKAEDPPVCHWSAQVTQPGVPPRGWRGEPSSRPTVKLGTSVTAPAVPSSGTSTTQTCWTPAAWLASLPLDARGRHRFSET